MRMMVPRRATSVRGDRRGMKTSLYHSSLFSFTRKTLVRKPARNGMPR